MNRRSVWALIVASATGVACQALLNVERDGGPAESPDAGDGAAASADVATIDASSDAGGDVAADAETCIDVLDLDYNDPATIFFVGVKGIENGSIEGQDAGYVVFKTSPPVADAGDAGYSAIIGYPIAHPQGLVRRMTATARVRLAVGPHSPAIYLVTEVGDASIGAIAGFADQKFRVFTVDKTDGGFMGVGPTVLSTGWYDIVLDETRQADGGTVVRGEISGAKTDPEFLPMLKLDGGVETVLIVGIADQPGAELHVDHVHVRVCP